MSVFKANTILVLLFSVLFSCISSAQNQPDEKKDILKPAYILNAHLGSFLPSQINGVTEVLPMWGFGYSVPSRKGFLEFGGELSQAKGTSYYIGHVEYRGDFPLEDLLISAAIGADVHFYKAADSVDPTTGNLTTYNYATYGGGHISGGIIAHIGDQLWFKTLMKFNISPGASMYVGFGFELRPARDQATEKPN